jgi:hypothetical protein
VLSRGWLASVGLRWNGKVQKAIKLNFQSLFRPILISIVSVMQKNELQKRNNARFAFISFVIQLHQSAEF